MYNKKSKKARISNGVRKIPRIVITAGPTIEPIDPVRFISNRSTGQMGYALAEEAKRRGYRVTLISGPANIRPPRGIKSLSVETARELYRKTLKEFKKADMLVMASAVADFRPRFVSNSKIKSRKSVTLKLVKNPDILGAISKKEKRGKVLVGFSLETENLLKNARKKLKDKNLDLIIANRTSPKGSAFGKGKKSVYILGKKGLKKSLKNVTKKRIARAILDTVEELCYTPD